MTIRAGAPVVVGVDGSQSSLDAVTVAAAEAALRRRSLRIVHAYTWPPVGVGLAPETAPAALDACRSQAEEIVKAAGAVAGKAAPDVVTTAEIMRGPAVPALVAESEKADLLVVGDRGAGGFPGLTVGSVAVQSATRSACPVLIARAAHRPGGEIVVGVDGSPNSALALEFAVEEASLRGVGLVALHAWNGNSRTELNADLPMTYEFWSGEAEEKRVLAEALAGVADRYPDVRIRRCVMRGSPRRLLVDQSLTAQLVVVGDRGHGVFTGPLLGSVSQYLIHRASCPIAVVRPGMVAAVSG